MTFDHAAPTVRLSVVLPAFNEAENIPRAITAAVDALERLNISFEIIVVDDGSHDDTGTLAQAAQREDPRVRAVHHPRNRGYGAALKSGILSARGELIFFTDADLQFDLNELRLLLARAREADIIAGYRARRSDPKHRLINAWAWGRLVKLLFGLDVRDVDCAFKVFHREVFEQVPISSVGAFVNTEILLRAQAEGFTITQVPVSHYPRTAGTSTGANPKVIARAFWELGRLYRELKRL
ncbi:MAG: glycosyltransferase family 2 protein [Deltaproteobacteria bacterium]|jgi:glycosyltransferase involved in cell wall biosynthesis|nr:glycosyltransferase family 2 protein [Deltaproteobacteria bacterium]MCK6516627.1 glycosyltransferase family 2 protein [Myxococcota bacterium]